MSSSKLRFRARGSALVQNHERLEAGIKSFIGRKFEEVQAAQNGEPAVFGFVPIGKDEEVAFNYEYVKACRDGDLWPADEATATACGVAFDSSFGAPKAEAKSSKADKA
jgi:hypothetical protein